MCFAEMLRNHSRFRSREFLRYRLNNKRQRGCRTMQNMHIQPFAALTPDIVLDALDGIGLHGDGRLLPSTAMRTGLPGRDGNRAAIDRQILSAGALVRRRNPGRTRFCRGAGRARNSRRARFGNQRPHAAFVQRFPLFRVHQTRRTRAGTGQPRHARMDGTLHRTYPCSRRIAAVPLSSRAGHSEFGIEPGAYLLEHNFIPAELAEVYRGVVAQALDGVRRC